VTNDIPRTDNHGHLPFFFPIPSERDVTLNLLRRFWHFVANAVPDDDTRPKVLAEFAALERGCEHLLARLFSVIRYRLLRDQLGLGDMHVSDAPPPDDSEFGSGPSPFLDVSDASSAMEADEE
jgi:hypothetical protein